MEKQIRTIGQNSKNEYDPKMAKAFLACAETYLEHCDRLIYSFGSKTFLNGYELFDKEYDCRGNIDCSTFVLLVLSGISYEKSPYVTKEIKTLHADPNFIADPSLVDFAKLPDRYIDIAERIGHPELRGPKGLDLQKAEKLGIHLEDLVDKIQDSGMVRWSAKIAQYLLDRGACFTDASCAMSGDLVFFRFPEFFTEGERKYKSNGEVSHVGIITEDTDFMINSSGSYQKERNAGAVSPAVSVDPVLGKRKPAFFARPVFSATFRT